MQRPQWVLVKEGYRVTKRFMRDGMRLPTPVWQRWLAWLAGGWLATLLFLLLLIWLTQTLLATGLLSEAREGRWLQWIIDLAPIQFSDAVWLSAPGDITIIVPIIIAAAVAAVRARNPILGLTLFLSYFLISAIVLVGWLVWDRPRPELVANGIAAPDFHSFPSGHIAQSITVYGLFCYLWLRRSQRRSEKLFGLLLLGVWLGNIALTRLVLGAHWPSDLAAGALLGCFWLGVLIVTLRRTETHVDIAQAPVTLAERFSQTGNVVSE